MRPHGRAEISPTSPRARGVCDRCGFIYSHHQLRWQYDWRGPKVQNLRILVCQTCTDQMQMNGQRTILIPADPTPIQNARPESYVALDNPLSGLGGTPIGINQSYGSFIGTMLEGGGLNAAFDRSANKRQLASAMISTPNSSFENYVGVNWSGYPMTATSSLNGPVLTHTLLSWTIQAPNNTTFGSTTYLVQGAPVNVGFGAWTTIASGHPAGTLGETITGTGGGGPFQFHRAAFWGSTSPIAVAQVEFSVAEVSSQGGHV